MGILLMLTTLTCSLVVSSSELTDTSCLAELSASVLTSPNLADWSPSWRCSSASFLLKNSVRTSILLWRSFAFIISSVSSYFGYYTNGGALDVGRSSTKAVVYSSIIVLIFNFLLTDLLLA